MRSTRKPFGITLLGLWLAAMTACWFRCAAAALSPAAPAEAGCCGHAPAAPHTPDDAGRNSSCPFCPEAAYVAGPPCAGLPVLEEEEAAIPLPPEVAESPAPAPFIAQASHRWPPDPSPPACRALGRHARAHGPPAA